MVYEKGSSEWYRAIGGAFGIITAVYGSAAIGSYHFWGWQFGTITTQYFSVSVSPVMLLAVGTAVSGVLSWTCLWRWVAKSHEEIDNYGRIEDDPRRNL